MIRAQAARDVAYLRLRQLLELPVNTPSRSTSISMRRRAPPPAFAEALAQHATRQRAGRTHARRTSRTAVQAREAGVSVACAERMPSVNLASSHGQVGYPGNAFTPTFNDFRTNWTMGAVVQVPIFTGNRLRK